MFLIRLAALREDQLSSHLRDSEVLPFIWYVTYVETTHLKELFLGLIIGDC